MVELSILLVDDDKILVEKLEKTMNWEKLGISIVLSAYNIRQAQKILQEYPIQIMLCDISMPQGSGLELLEWIREQHLDVECVFLSSYASFSYAQMALQFGASDYILKPVSNQDLSRSLEKVIDSLKKKKVIGYTPRREFWNHVLLQEQSEELCVEEALKKNLIGKEEKFILVWVRILEERAHETERKEIALYDYAIRNHADSCLKDSGLEGVVHVRDLEWMLVLQEEEGFLTDGMQKFKELLEKGIERNAVIYVGEKRTIFDLEEAKNQLKKFVRTIVPDEEEILYENQMPKQTVQNAAPFEIWYRELIEFQKPKVVEERILDFINEQSQRGGIPRKNLVIFLRELNQLLYRCLNEWKISYSRLFDEIEFTHMERAAEESVTGTRRFVQYIFEKLKGGIQDTDSRQDLIEKLKAYIEDHLGDDLSRTVLAETFFLSEGYISKLFLKETGGSLPSFIAELRMNRAKEYLENSSLPVSRIAIEVGYNNFSYFSKTFRDMMGCTPNEYRSMINKKKQCQ